MFDTSTGQPVTVFGKKGVGRKEFDSPCDVEADAENRVVARSGDGCLKLMEISLPTAERVHKHPAELLGWGQVGESRATSISII